MRKRAFDLYLVAVPLGIARPVFTDHCIIDNAIAVYREMSALAVCRCANFQLDSIVIVSYRSIAARDTRS